ncbi:MAG: ABC transporter ATP-binding protein [Anaerolineae bacterium]
MIEVEHLTKQYGEIVAVNDLTFTANRGVTGFLGPNGAGKTTTMRMLTGYTPPTSGHIRVAGYDVFKDSLNVRRRVGYLPENVPLYRDMTARGYLMYLAEIRGVKNRGARADEVLELVGLIHRAEWRIRTLSKGMRQRVGLASTLLHDPEVLILDEPTIGLDPFQVLELRQLVRELGLNHTVLFSTHILAEAEQVSDQVVIVHQGKLVAQGAPADLRTQLERGGRVLVRASVPPEQLLPTVREAQGVSAAAVSLDGVIATPANGADPRPALARAVLDHGWDLLELRPVAASLEEIFLELTRQQDRPSSDPQEQPAAEVEETAS